MSRREFLFSSLAVLVSSCVSGCITSRLFDPKHYTEEVASVLITKDEKQLIVITTGYHYIFDAPPILVNSLKSSFHQALNADISNFFVRSTGETTGRVRLYLRGATDEALRAAIDSGFTKTPTGASTTAVLKGNRYQAGSVQPTVQYKLNKTYQVGVIAEQSSGEKAAKSMLTPITVAADGVLILFGVPLLILTIGIGCKIDAGCLR